jgi:hypothetical protein
VTPALPVEPGDPVEQRKQWRGRVADAAGRAADDLREAEHPEVRGLVGPLEALRTRLRTEDEAKGGYARTMDARQERIGRNEALFREVNERLQEIGTSFNLVGETADFVCECGDLTCAEPIRMTLADYEGVRAKPNRFFVVPGHDIPDVESVVERHERWEIVEKHAGGPAELAAEEDPRS